MPLTRICLTGPCAALFIVLAASMAVAQAPEREKLADDPTKIVTKAGARYSDFGTIFASVAFGPVSKINVSISEGEQWRLGGSYLFDFGIVNVAASRQTLSNGSNQIQYSIGTFVPLVAFGFEPGGWLLFPAAGANYTEASLDSIPIEFAESISMEVSSKGGYAGLLALKSLSDEWVLKSGVVASAGSNDYSGTSIGAGLTYSLTPRDSLSVSGSYIDNSFGQRELVGISYTREF